MYLRVPYWGPKRTFMGRAESAARREACGRVHIV
jgi:hypothetical protein